MGEEEEEEEKKDDEEEDVKNWGVGGDVLRWFRFFSLVVRARR